MLNAKAEALGRIKNAAAAQAADTDRLVAKGPEARPFAQACRAELDGTLDLLRSAYRIVRDRPEGSARMPVLVGRGPVGPWIPKERTVSDSLAAWDTWRGNDRVRDQWRVEAGVGDTDVSDTSPVIALLAELADEAPDLGDLADPEGREDRVYAWNAWQRKRLTALCRLVGKLPKPGRNYLGLPTFGSDGAETIVAAWLEESPRLGLLSLRFQYEQRKEVFTSSDVRVDWSEACDPPDIEVDGGLGYGPDADIRDRQLLEGGQLLVAQVAEDAVLLSPEQIDSILLAKERYDALIGA